MKLDARVVFGVLALVAVPVAVLSFRGCCDGGEGGEPVAPLPPTEGERPVDESRFRGPLVSTMALAEGRAGGDTQASSARESVSLQYDALLETLDLPPQVQRAVEDALVARFEDRVAGGESGAPLGERLAQLLSYEQAEIWFEYEEFLPERVLGESVELELRGMGAGLAEEVLGRACDIVVEEYLSAGVGPNFAFGATAHEPLETIVAKQRQALAQMRTRFSNEFDEEQMAVLTPFLERHEEVAAMTLDVIGSGERGGVRLDAGTDAKLGA